jgi:hypothetical protein
MCKKMNHFVFLVLLATVHHTMTAQGIDPGTGNLTHSWTFNDGTTKDYVGGANGTLMGGAYIFESSLFTDNSGSWMEMPADKIAMNTYKEVTIEMWFVPLGNGNTGYTMLAYFGNTKNRVGVNGYFMCAARGDDKSRAAISCGVEVNPWSGESGANGPEYDDGELHHMVSTLDSANITLYIDGQFQASTPLATNNRIDSISSTFAYLAKSGYMDDSTWLGQILEFNIYNKALDSAAVRFLFNKGASTTGVEKEIAALPKEYRLLQNYPNPFNPSTTIKFDLAKSGNASLRVYDMLGRPVATLVDGELEAGDHTANFNASNLAAGVYFYSLQAGDFSSVKKLILLK